MTGPHLPPIKVDILAGENTAIPALQGTRAEIVRVAAGASGGLSPLQKLSKALVLAEAREGGLALRAVRTGLTELAAHATEVSGPVAKVVEAIGGLGLGGPVALGVTAGIGVIALAYREFKADAEAARKAQEDFLTSLAKGGPHAAALGARGQLNELLRQRDEAITKAREAAGFAGRSPTEAELAVLPSVAAINQAIVEKKREIAQLERDAADAAGEHKKHLQEILDKEHELARERHEDMLPTRPQDRVGADLYLRAALGQGGNLLTPGVTEAGTTPLANTILATMNAGSAHETPKPTTTKDKQELGKDIGVGIAATLALVGGASKGDAGSLFAGLGGAASSLGSIKALSGLTALPVLGSILSGLGGLFSLFSGHKTIPVQIMGYDSRALTQQQQLMLALTGRKGVAIDILSPNSDAGRIIYELGRQGRTDGVMRVPPGVAA